MDGMTFYGRRFITEQDTATLDRRAMRVALAMSAAMVMVVVAAALLLNATGLVLPGIGQSGNVPLGG